MYPNSNTSNKGFGCCFVVYLWSVFVFKLIGIMLGIKTPNQILQIDHHIEIIKIETYNKYKNNTRELCGSTDKVRSMSSKTTKEIHYEEKCYKKSSLYLL